MKARQPITTMKTTPLLHTCSRLLSSRLVAALAVAALSMQSLWAAPAPAQQAYVKASNTGGMTSWLHGNRCQQLSRGYSSTPIHQIQCPQRLTKRLVANHQQRHHGRRRPEDLRGDQHPGCAAEIFPAAQPLSAAVGGYAVKRPWRPSMSRLRQTHS